MPAQPDIVVAVANPRLRARLTAELRARGAAVRTTRDLEDLTRLLAVPPPESPGSARVLVLDEAFIYPDVYEECARLKAASRLPLAIVLLVEPRTRTRSDWHGVDEIIRLPATAAHVAAHALRRRNRSAGLVLKGVASMVMAATEASHLSGSAGL